MLPNSFEKAAKLKEPDFHMKKRSSNLHYNNSIRHNRSQSSSSSSVSHELQSSAFENNKRGWLEPTTSVQVNPSRSLDMRKSSSIPTTANMKKPLITDVLQKDILGAVSDEDIFKLTELTARLPDVPPANNKPPKQHHRHRTATDEHNITRKSKQSEQPSDGGVKINDPVIITSDVPSSPPLSTQNSSDINLDSPEKRRSWLYKSLIKPYKKGSSSKSSPSGKSNSTASSADDHFMSPAASIADEFYRAMESEDEKKSTPEGFKRKLRSQKRFSHSPFHARSNSSHVTSTSATPSNMSRRHSFDSFQSHLITEEPTTAQFEKLDTSNFEDQALAKWDQERKQEREKPNFGYSHEERPNFHLVISTDDVHDEHIQSIPTSDDEYVTNTGKSTPAIVAEDMESSSDMEDIVTFMFDYYSLPVEIKSLIDTYEHKGKAERKKMIVKYRKKSVDEDDEKNGDQLSDDEEEEESDVDNEEEEEDDEDDEEEEGDTRYETVDYRDLITGNYADRKKKGLRDIAVVTTSRSDNIEFTKLIQIAMGPSSSSDNNEPLLDLHVSLFGDNDIDSDTNIHQDEFQDAILSIEKSLEKFTEFREQSADFLRDHIRTMETLNLYNDKEYVPKLPRTNSFPTLKATASDSTPSSEEFESTSSSGSSLSSSMSSDRPNSEMTPRDLYHRNAHSMYGGNGEFISRDPFDLRQREINALVKGLGKDLDRFKESLVKTEDLVRDVQVDMDDTRNRMETYIKDIPESHYSALKKLEVDIELILSKRAKNPWLDTGYALLSYLLTLFALVVWIIIYMLKWGKKVVLFPKKLWQSYSEYVVERNKAVKKASVLSLSKKERTTRRSSDEHPLFQRTHRNSSQASRDT